MTIVLDSRRFGAVLAAAMLGFGAGFHTQAAEPAASTAPAVEASPNGLSDSAVSAGDVSTEKAPATGVSTDPASTGSTSAGTVPAGNGPSAAGGNSDREATTAAPAVAAGDSSGADAPPSADSARRSLGGLGAERLRLLGLAALAEPAVAEQLILSPAQKAKVGEVLKSRLEKLLGADSTQAEGIHAETERQLDALLTDQQRVAWGILIAGERYAATSPAAVEASGTSTAGSSAPSVGPSSPAAADSPSPASAASASATRGAPESPSPPPGAALDRPSARPAIEGSAPTTLEHPADHAASDPRPATAGESTSGHGPSADAEQPAPPAQSPGTIAPTPTSESRADPELPRIVGPTSAGAASGESTSPAEPAGSGASKTEVSPTAESSVTSPASAAEASPAATAGQPSSLTRPGEGSSEAAERKLRFRFRFQPWKDVLDWFAEQADLSLVLETPPPGTFNYTDQREYTPAEAIDLLNSVLLTKGYTLVRRDRMLMLINLEDGIPPNLVSTIAPEEIDRRGEFELVKVIFQLDRVSPEEAEAEVGKLLGPQGSVVALPKSRQILVTETAGRLKAIRSVIQRLEDPEGIATGEVKAFELNQATAEQALGVIRQLLDIPPDRNAATDGSLRLTSDASGTRLLVSGRPEMVARVGEILELIDQGKPGDATGDVPEGDPQLEVYTVTAADPQSVLAVMQTLLAGLPDVRLAIDPQTGNLVALARPSQHATIRATLEQLQRDAKRVEVFQLRLVDAQSAVAAARKLFGIVIDEKNPTKVDPNLPQIDADAANRMLLVRGTQAQIDQIRELLGKMGESDTSVVPVAGKGNVRMLPIQGAAAESALERIQEIWPSIRPNRIRVVAPSSTIPTFRPSGEPPAGAGSAAPAQSPRPEAPAPGRPERAEPSAAARPAPRFILVSSSTDGEVVDEHEEEHAAGQPAHEAPDEPDDLAPANAAAVDGRATRAGPPRIAPLPVDGSLGGLARSLLGDPQSQGGGEPPAIIVAPGPGGVLIASSDEEALDEFERLLSGLASEPMVGDVEITVFYLKHAKAALVADTLNRILGGASAGSEGSGGGGGGGLPGFGMAGMGGGILGALLGMGGESSAPTATGKVQITPDSRLNALIVQANPADVATIEQLLKILDQKESPEDILVVPKVKVIPVVNTQAQEIADVLKQVYQDRMISGSSGGAAGMPRPPSPQEFIQLLRGGGRGGSRGSSAGGSQGAAAEEIQRMAVSVDARTNSLVLAAPEPLFSEVEQLVADLDRAAVKSDQMIRVVPLHHSSPTAVRQALTALAGDKVQFGSTPGRTGTTQRTQQRPASGLARPSGAAMPLPQFNPTMGQSRVFPSGGNRTTFGGTTRSGR